MIEIHSHILPALDDGPDDMETSVAMGRIAAEEGTRAFISTSHGHEAAEEGREAMETRLQAVREAWAAAGLNIELHLGVEIFLDFDTLDNLKSGKLWTLAGSQYVLVELPYSPWPPYAERAMFDLQLAGYLPILAHPERYTAIQDDPNLMYRLAERGILGQVTAAALIGDHGEKYKNCSDVLVRHGLVQFIASDAHSAKSKRRMPLLREAINVATELVGEAQALSMVEDNPARILSSRHINPSPTPVETKRSLFGGLFGRK